MPFLSNLPRLRSPADIVTYLTLFPAISVIGKALQGCESLIDLGCGENSWIRLLRFPGEKRGVDAWEPAVRRSAAARIHDTYAVGDIRTLPLEPADAILCLDVIEHLPKGDSAAVVESLDRLARRLVVVITPNGFLEQHPVDGNEMQRHRCGWSSAELRQAGFEVFGIEGLRGLRGEFGRIARRPKAFWWLVSKFSEAYVWHHPERAFALMAMKRK